MSCVVILPVHKIDLSDIEKASIFHNISILRNWDHVILCPKSILNDVKLLFKQALCSRLNFCALEDSNFKSVTTYDQMLTKVDFYKMFEDYKYLLITQPDVVIFKDEVQYWIDKDIDYIGAPWIINFSKDKDNYYVGNGGVSLRNINSFINALNKLRILKCPHWYLQVKKVPSFFHRVAQYSFGFNLFLFFKKTHEDFFWSQLIPSSNKNFKVACIGDSFNFAIERFRKDDEINFSIENSPFAIHAWEKHAPKNVNSLIKKLISKKNINVSKI